MPVGSLLDEATSPLGTASAEDRAARRLATVFVLGSVLLGLALRIFILTHAPTGIADSDEAVTGLIARHLVSHPGSFSVFAWDTNYAGTLETVFTAIPFALFGSSVLALKLTVAVMHIGACLVLWRVGRRLIDERTGIVAACALWVWPGIFVWWSTKARDYEVLLICGLLTLLLALRLVEDATRRRDWLAFGAAVGVGWWTNPQIAYLAVPAGLWILLGNGRAVRHAAIAVPGFLLGAFPWIVWNLRHHGGSLHSQFGSTEGYVAHLHRFWAEGVPVALGLRKPYLLAWVGPQTRVAYLGLLLAAGLSLVLGRRPGARALAVALIVYPLVHALAPIANFTGEARYLYLYGPIIVLVVARAVRRPAAIATLFGVMTISTVVSLTTMHLGIAGAASNQPVPAKMGSLIRTLEAEKVDAVTADYWIAYRLTFESRERIIATGMPAHRYQPYQDYVRARRRSAWVFLNGSVAEQHFNAGLAQQGIRSRTLRTGGFSIHIPERPVLPEQVRYQ